MKYWNEIKIGEITPMCKDENDFSSDRVLSVKLIPHGKVRFREECDGYYNIDLSKEDAAEMLKEAIEYISDKTKQKL